MGEGGERERDTLLSTEAAPVTPCHTMLTLGLPGKGARASSSGTSSMGWVDTYLWKGVAGATQGSARVEGSGIHRK